MKFFCSVAAFFVFLSSGLCADNINPSWKAVLCRPNTGVSFVVTFANDGKQVKDVELMIGNDQKPLLKNKDSKKFLQKAKERLLQTLSSLRVESRNTKYVFDVPCSQ